jgi:cation diffusion facilitator CzcD-associated flavoprotein CzcO
MSSKTVAIIGAGPLGLAAAKYALEYGLTPFVFKKANDIGDDSGSRVQLLGRDYILMLASIFSATPTIPGPKIKIFFPSKNEIHAYLKSYADIFMIEQQLDIVSKENEILAEDMFKSEKINFEPIEILSEDLVGSIYFAKAGGDKFNQTVTNDY